MYAVVRPPCGPTITPILGNGWELTAVTCSEVPELLHQPLAAALRSEWLNLKPLMFATIRRLVSTSVGNRPIQS